MRSAVPQLLLHQRLPLSRLLPPRARKREFGGRSSMSEAEGCDHGEIDRFRSGRANGAAARLDDCR
jgi:hypothetical protein